MSKSNRVFMMAGSRAVLRTALLIAGVVCLFAVAAHAAPLEGGETGGETEAPGTGPEADAVRSASHDGACEESATVLCLQDGRYEVTLDFTTSVETAPASVARPRTRDSGLFYFFEPNNWEMLLKVLDGCGINQHHWVFAASATDVGLNLTVRDTMTGASKTYTKEPGDPAPAITDVGAFPEACAAQ